MAQVPGDQQVLELGLLPEAQGGAPKAGLFLTKQQCQPFHHAITQCQPCSQDADFPV